MVKNLSQCSRSEIARFLNSFDNILFDCDGVILLGDKIIPGVKESIQYLQANGKGMKLITNNSFRTESDWNNIFENVGLNFRSEDVIFPPKAVASYLKQENFNKKVFVVGPPGMRKQLEQSGLDIYNYKPCDKLQELDEIKHHAIDDEQIGAVVVDLDFNLTYAKLVKAGIVLKRPDVLFILCACDKTVPLGDNFKTIGSGFIGETLEMISGRRPMVIGKPSSLYNEIVQDNFNINPERTLFVGDSLITDMLFATRCGYKKLLVLSGTTSHQDMVNCPKDFAPKYYLNSLADIKTFIN